MLESLAPGSILGAGLIILFEAEVGLGFKHPSPELCSFSSELPTSPATQTLCTWSLPSDSSDLSHWTACCLWWTDGIPWVHSCSCLALLVSPAHVDHLWLKHSHAISGPPQSSLVCDMLEELAHPITDHVTGTQEAVEQRGWEHGLWSRASWCKFWLAVTSHVTAATFSLYLSLSYGDSLRTSNK